MGGESITKRDSHVSTGNNDNGLGATEKGMKGTTNTSTALSLRRYRVGNFAAGVLTNVMQLQRWTYPSEAEVEEDGGGDSGDESDGGRGFLDSGGADGLPFHPAFMDAAVLTLTTPKWPLILDPEGIALRQVAARC